MTHPVSTSLKVYGLGTLRSFSISDFRLRVYWGTGNGYSFARSVTSSTSISGEPMTRLLNVSSVFLVVQPSKIIILI